MSFVYAVAVHAVLFVALAAMGHARPRAPLAPIEVSVVHVDPARPDPVRETPQPEGEPPPAMQAPAPPPPPAPRRRHTQARAAATAPAAPARAGDDAPAVPAAPFPAPAPTVPVAAAEPEPMPAAPAPARVSVTAKPLYRSNPRPDYPIDARRRREEGVVLLDVAVEPNGRAASVSLKRTSGSTSLDSAAIDAVRRWIFEPARADGQAIAANVVVPVRFSLDDR